MKKLLNTLYILSEDAYCFLDNENIVIKRGNIETGRFPLHGLESIVTFAYAGASPALMGECARRNIMLSFCSPNGKFLARVNGYTNGNILLRREQYRIADDKEKSCRIARNMIFGKVYNSKWTVSRTIRDHSLRINADRLTNVCNRLQEQLGIIKKVESLDVLRGVEGGAAVDYFSIFNELILVNKDSFCFNSRNRRPPLDNVNALLSFVYSLLTNDCAGALETVGLDSFAGFMHVDRPGRKSLALDIMEELRPCFADRFVLTCINNRVVNGDHFKKIDNNAVLLGDEGRKKIISAWQERKKEEIIHPYLQEKIQWGLVPYIQALLLARNIRGDIDGYPPFLWK